MSISDADFLEWITNQRSIRTVLVEYSYDGGTMGYAANRPYFSKTGDTPASVGYQEIIAEDIRYKRSVSWDLSLGSSSSKGDIVLNLTDELENLVYADFYNSEIVVLVGDSTWSRSDFRVMMKGTCSGSKFQNRQLILSFKDEGDFLNVPFDFVQVTQSNGTVSNAPISLGYVFNATPLTINPSTKKYQISGVAIDTFIDVKDDGVSVGYTGTTSAGTFVLTSAPSGQVTADVFYTSGTLTLKSSFTHDYTPLVVSEYVFKNFCAIDTSDLLTDIVSDYATYSNTLGSFNDSGYYIDSPNITKLQVVNDLLKSVGFFWFFTRDGKLQFSTLNTKSTVFTDWHYKTSKPFEAEIVQNSIKLVEIVRLGFGCSAKSEKNWTVLTSIASSITGYTRDSLAREYYLDLSYSTASDRQIAYPPMLIYNNSNELKTRTKYRANDKLVYELDVTNAYIYDIGDLATIDYEEFGFYKGGANQYTVLSINENIMTGLATMGIMCDKF